MAREMIYSASTPQEMRSLGGSPYEGYTKNLLPQNGELKKRKGWRVLNSFRSSEQKPLEINGIYEYKGEDKSALIVRAGQRLYECDYEIGGLSLINSSVLPSGRGQGQMFAGRLWLGNTGGLMYYDGTEVKNAQAGTGLYVPHTSMDIRDTESSALPAIKDAPNLLTRRRVNTLRGEKHGAQEYRFPLDSEVMYGEPFSLTAEFRVRRDQSGESGPRTTDYIAKIGDEVIGGIITAYFETDSLFEDVPVPLTAVSDENGVEVSVEGASLSCRVEKGRWVVLSFNAVAHEVRDNIRVEFSVAKPLPTLEADTFATVEGQGGGFLLFSCGGNRLYALYEHGEGLYIPENQTKDVGQKTEKITAILPMPNGSVGIYKENGFYTLHQFEKGLDVGQVYASSDFYGCISPFVSVRIGYDCISFCKEGVFSAPEVENAEYPTNRLYHISSSIQDKLSSYSYEEMAGACSAVFENRYYLFIGGCAYVADLAGENTLSWWMLDFCPCRFAAAIGGRLYMGRDSGDISVFDGGYTDRDGIVLTEAGLDFALFDEADGTLAVINRALKAQEGDTVCLPEHYDLLGEVEFDSKTSEISVPTEIFFTPDGYASLYEGMEILLIDSDGYEAYQGELLETDMWKSSIYCGNLGIGQDCSLKLYVKRGQDTEYELKTVGRQLYLYLDGSAVHLYSCDLEYLYLKREREIECELCTSQSDLENGKEKQLLSLSVSLDSKSRGTLLVGYQTEKNGYSREIRLGDGVDFEGFDFGDVDLGIKTKRRVRINCLEKGFDYISVRLLCKTGGEISIDGISLTYTVK